MPLMLLQCQWSGDNLRGADGDSRDADAMSVVLVACERVRRDAVYVCTDTVGCRPWCGGNDLVRVVTTATMAVTMSEVLCRVR